MDQKTLSKKGINIFREIKEQQLKSIESVLKGRERGRGREREGEEKKSSEEINIRNFKRSSLR